MLFSRRSLIHPFLRQGWSCCKPRVLDFNDFLGIEPCTTAEHGHLFVGAPKKASEEHTTLGYEPVECRLDHYETPSQVHVTVYAKGVDTSNSKIELQDSAVTLSLSLPPLASAGADALPRRHERVLRPFAAIDPEKSSYNVTKFKVEMILVKKVAGQSWTSLESSDKSFGYGLTFGRHHDVLV